MCCCQGYYEEPDVIEPYLVTGKGWILSPAEGWINESELESFMEFLERAAVSRLSVLVNREIGKTVESFG